MTDSGGHDNSRQCAVPQHADTKYVKGRFDMAKCCAQCLSLLTSWASGLRVMAITSPIFILLRRMYGAVPAHNMRSQIF